MSNGRGLSDRGASTTFTLQADGLNFTAKASKFDDGLRALKRVAAGEPLREVALSYAVDHSTISRLKARHAAEM